MAASAYMTAQEAAATLEISLSTLYAYVSRGLIRSESIGNTRTRCYRIDDVNALKSRKEQRQNPSKVAEQALRWGEPVLESAISLITDGQFYYRGQDALTLAVTRTVEEVAWLIWTGDLIHPPDVSPGPDLSSGWQATRHQISALPPFEAMQVLLPLAATEDWTAYDLRPATVAHTGLRILRLLAAIAVGQLPSSEPIASVLQRGWIPSLPQAVAGLNTALIICADHELNVSSFTARCVASAASNPYAVVTAGLAALQGTKHGGYTARAEALFNEVGTPERARAVLSQRLRRGESIPGFGHHLYPEGDPRCQHLLDLTARLCPTASAVALSQAICDAAYDLIGEYPNIDYGLITLALALRLPPSGALTLFAIGRTIGWIGQAIEAYQEDRLIRPRARYVGITPESS
ncbi:hypothetical protein C2W62_20515 [Candidatus Entotheonella serta]|nr:hypothetical protein C2W62_20515 [Candidatus Entotheonella serta]